MNEHSAESESRSGAFSSKPSSGPFSSQPPTGPFSSKPSSGPFSSKPPSGPFSGGHSFGGWQSADWQQLPASGQQPPGGGQQWSTQADQPGEAQPGGEPKPGQPEQGHDRVYTFLAYLVMALAIVVVPAVIVGSILFSRGVDARCSQRSDAFAQQNQVLDRALAKADTVRQRVEGPKPESFSNGFGAPGTGDKEVNALYKARNKATDARWMEEPGCSVWMKYIYSSIHRFDDALAERAAAADALNKATDRYASALDAYRMDYASHVAAADMSRSTYNLAATRQDFAYWIQFIDRHPEYRERPGVTAAYDDLKAADAAAQKISTKVATGSIQEAQDTIARADRIEAAADGLKKKGNALGDAIGPYCDVTGGWKVCTDGKGHTTLDKVDGSH